MFAPLALAITFNVAQAVKDAMPPVCHDVRIAKYIAQAYDATNTARAIQYRNMRETDPVARTFGRHDPFVAFISDVVIDVVADALTRHAPVVRCTTDAWLLHEAIRGTVFTNGPHQ